MRISEIIFESADYPEFDDGAIEDEADTRGDASLITALEYLRNEAKQSNAVSPRVKVDTVIQRVRAMPGNEAFNYAALEKAQTDNETVKSMIKSIDDDTHTGTKYIYLSPPENTVDATDPLGAKTADPGASSKIVSNMAKRAST
jgi:hypothetical protein